MSWFIGRSTPALPLLLGFIMSSAGGGTSAGGLPSSAGVSLPPSSRPSNGLHSAQIVMVNPLRAGMEAKAAPGTYEYECRTVLLFHVHLPFPSLPFPPFLTFRSLPILSLYAFVSIPSFCFEFPVVLFSFHFIMSGLIPSHWETIGTFLLSVRILLARACPAQATKLAARRSVKSPPSTTRESLRLFCFPFFFF